MFAIYRNYIYVLIGAMCERYKTQVGWVVYFWLQTVRCWGQRVGERLTRSEKHIRRNRWETGEMLVKHKIGSKKSAGHVK